jgi:cellobiose phosphorylase
VRYGHFDDNRLEDDKRPEYVITRPDTPLPRINCLGPGTFFGAISNTVDGGDHPVARGAAGRCRPRPRRGQ